MEGMGLTVERHFSPFPSLTMQSSETNAAAGRPTGETEDAGGYRSNLQHFLTHRDREGEGGQPSTLERQKFLGCSSSFLLMLVFHLVVLNKESLWTIGSLCGWLRVSVDG